MEAPKRLQDARLDLQNNSTEAKLQNLKVKAKKFLFGMNAQGGFIYNFIVYFLLIVFGFVFIYPLLFMFATSIMGPVDLIDTSVKWFPTDWYLASNYGEAIHQLNFAKVFFNSVIVAVLPSAINTVVCCLTGYGFARFNFKGKNILFALLLTSFIIPKYLISIPTFAWYSNLGILGTLWSYIIPSSFGQGLYSVIYILIFWSNFKLIPKQLEESAKIDGCSPIGIFFKIALPLVTGAMITVFIFSVVWYWNDSQTAGTYLNQAGKDNWVTLPLMVERYEQYIGTIAQGPAAIVYNGIKMAATMLTILPLLVLYFALQRFFVESVERSGITGE